MYKPVNPAIKEYVKRFGETDAVKNVSKEMDSMTRDEIQCLKSKIGGYVAVDTRERVLLFGLEIPMKCSKDEATHFLSYENPETGAADLLDCIPLESRADGITLAVVFSDHEDSWTVEVVDWERVLSAEDLFRNIMNRVVNDLVLVDPENDQTAH